MAKSSPCFTSRPEPSGFDSAKPAVLSLPPMTTRSPAPATPPDARQTTDWLAVLVLFAAGLAAAMHFAKVAPVMDATGRELGLSLVASGFAVSLLGIVGVVFAIATGAVVAAIGLKRGMAIALFGGAAIAALGSAAPTGMTFLATRFLEGFSHLLIVVCAPALMAMHAAPKDRPIALSLWGCFFGLGFAITSSVAPLIVPGFGWRGLMLGHALLLALIGIAVLLVLGRSGHQDQRKPFPDFGQLLKAHADVYGSGPPLLLALTFCCYTILFLAALTFLGKYLIDALGWSAAAAGSMLAFAALVSMAFTLSAGVLLRLRLPAVIGFTAAFLALAVGAIGVFGFQLPEPAVLGLILVMMASFGLLPGFTFASVPAVAPTPALAALTYGAIAQFGNVGTFLGTPVFAGFYGVMGWPGGVMFFTVICIAGVACATRLNRSMRV